MGAFDTIVVDNAVDLPGFPNGAERLFQTKCFRCELDVHRIIPDGTVVMKKQDWSKDGEYGPEEPSDLHGFAYVYTFIGDVRNWWEYRMNFTDGRLVSVVRTIPPDKGGKA